MAAQWLPGLDPSLVWGSKLTLSLHLQPGSIDSNKQLFAPGGRLSWGKGSSGGSGAKPADSGMRRGGWLGTVGLGGRRDPVLGRCRILRLPSFHAQHLIQGDQPQAP